MVDSRAKGRSAELKCRDELRKLTGLKWERTPLSGALSSNHMLKGDLYVPETKLKFCVEVKHYKDDSISTKLLTSVNPQFDIWWEQTIRESGQMKKDPLLIFKHNRSKWFTAFTDMNIGFNLMDSKFKYLMYPYEHTTIYICTLDTFIKLNPRWVST